MFANKIILMLCVAVCKYTKSTISECDPETHMRTITRDLIADESGANCDAQKLKTQVCSADGGSRRRERNRQRQAAKQDHPVLTPQRDDVIMRQRDGFFRSS